MLIAILLAVLSIYLVAGLLFVIPFLVKGIHTIDETAEGSSAGFYIMIIPGVLLLWPLLWKKWIIAGSSKKR